MSDTIRTTEDAALALIRGLYGDCKTEEVACDCGLCRKLTITITATVPWTGVTKPVVEVTGDTPNDAWAKAMNAARKHVTAQLRIVDMETAKREIEAYRYKAMRLRAIQALNGFDAPPPLPANLERLRVAAQSFAGCVSEFGADPNAYGERLEHLTAAIEAHERAELGPDDEFIEDYNRRVVGALVDLDGAMAAIDVPRIVRYLEHRVATQGESPVRWSRASMALHLSSNADETSRVVTRSARETWFASHGAGTAAETRAMVVVYGAPCYAILKRIAEFEGRHEALVIADILAPWLDARRVSEPAPTGG